jgi:hypothetical protein
LQKERKRERQRCAIAKKERKRVRNIWIERGTREYSKEVLKKNLKEFYPSTGLLQLTGQPLLPADEIFEDAVRDIYKLIIDETSSHFIFR